MSQLYKVKKYLDTPPGVELQIANTGRVLVHPRLFFHLLVLDCMDLKVQFLVLGSFSHAGQSLYSIFTCIVNAFSCDAVMLWSLVNVAMVKYIN